ncbi:LysM peptidoglycan-binding domain-containing protein [Leuconostoc gasicomitatum]|uniref:LysM peptidoglycan-binding domain-containing protein n=1 Tax=Leuconostoc gasicomitatum TaxID=115778 RepID=UPI000BC8F162|nr:LysM peptidoglycan-binding domain-containing protein [Leuconostoc gasicomitatum]MBZ5944770.1 LysM peptidoglycan-binding domain-containing protein [Leuconostoc gasicomitatum]MBZ5950081.1 LysM peptidoglycan-binding domain-containing protein [Leuconostoc gasicomitatum]MBZ5951362.1 LysM peptidoglycan-binding domain-containing protein [Leuconostoc gasicomitatum]MBZ5967748.1 LysM peptidoglycan-binding domain-containing protein [Leuconostoc gasicomitatum]MBZ5972658.1 LysM peptidoglycan-binding dom
MRSNLKKTLLATAAGVATLVGGHAVASADTVEVQTGDTLSGIAHANNTSTEDLAKANNITDQNLIIAGQKLTVSTPASSAVSADGTTYTVQTGDTLSKVAQQTGINIETLSSINDLSNHDFVLAGQVLALKQAVSQNTVPTVTATEQQAITPEITTEKLSYIAAADTNKDNFMSMDEYNTYKANGGNTTTTTVAQTPQVQATAPAATEQVTQVSTNTAPQAAPAASSDAQALVNSLNAKRASLGLAPVTLNASLSARAQERAENAAANGGIPTNHFSTNGEVVANGFSSGSVIDAWFNETNMSTPNGQPGHRMWVANARASSVGFGIVGGIIVGESDAGQF